MRSAETRNRVVTAAIECLHAFGYSVTTTTLVAVKAKVSRGAMTHQFPTKVDLMAAVVEYVFERDVRTYQALLPSMADGRERALGLAEAAWSAVSSPGGVAVLHILIATPGDAELKARLPEVLNRISRQAHADAHERGRSAGVQDDRLTDAATLLHMATLRGLAIEQISGNSPENIQMALALFRRYREYYVDVIGPLGFGVITDLTRPLPKS